MIKNYNQKSKTVEDAKNTLLSEHNANESDVIFTSVIENTKGVLGIGSKKAEVNMILKKDILEEGKQFLNTFLEKIQFEPKVEAYINNDVIKYKITTNDNARLIGKGGINLKNLDFFLKHLLEDYLDHVKVTIDIADYKENRDIKIKESAHRLARKSIINKQDFQAPPMNSYERRIFHTALGAYKEIYTESHGEEPNRYILIKYKKN